MTLINAGQVSGQRLGQQRKNSLAIDREVGSCIGVNSGRNQAQLAQTLSRPLNISTIQTTRKSVKRNFDGGCLELSIVSALPQEVVQQHGVAVLAILVLAEAMDQLVEKRFTVHKKTPLKIAISFCE